MAIHTNTSVKKIAKHYAERCFTVRKSRARSGFGDLAYSKIQTYVDNL